MKKNNFPLLALAALTLGSCSQDETLVENPAVNAPIEFGICSGKAAETRAGITTDQTIQGTDANAGFGVIAGYMSYYDFMWNQQVTYVESSDSWTYDPVKYWPTTQNAKLSFYAYAPYQEEPSPGNVIEFWEGDAEFNIQYNHQPDLSDNVDFVAARAVVDNTPDPDNMGKPKTVEFNFKHELTRLSLYAQVSEDVRKAEGKIVITDVRLDCTTGTGGKFYNKATYSYANGTWGPLGDDIGITNFNLNSVIAYQILPDDGLNVYNKVYTPSETYRNGIFILENTTPVNLCDGKVINPDDENAGDHLFLIPALHNNGDTGISATKLNLVVTYEIVTKESDTTIPVTKTVPIPSSSSSDGILFEQGIAYTFTLIFGVNDDVTLGADAMD